MEAKDTVKSYGELRTYCVNKGIYEPTELDLREANAEISFRAGQDSVFDSMPENLPPLLEMAHRSGIKEMVEWGNEPCPHIKEFLKRDCDLCRQAKLKDLGIE